jgi:hypothetical protein
MNHLSVPRTNTTLNMSLDSKNAVETLDRGSLRFPSRENFRLAREFFAPKQHTTSTLTGSGIRQILTAG